jgi:CheY-like chemotaxis protein
MEGRPKSRLILIADDDHEDQEMLEEAIADLDVNVRTAKVFNGRETITYLEQCSTELLPHAIILDYSMPVLNGYEVLIAIAGDQRFESIPKFIWSTSNSELHISECLKVGAIKYFVKPDHPNALKLIAREILAACS